MNRSNYETQMNIVLQSPSFKNLIHQIGFVLEKRVMIGFVTTVRGRQENKFKDYLVVCSVGIMFPQRM
jgi:hypothetical protein